MGQPSYFTGVETLLQRDTCPKRWFSFDTGSLSQSVYSQLKLGMNQHRRFQLKDEKTVSKRLLIVQYSLNKSCQRTTLFLTPWNHVFLNFCLKCNCQDRQPSPSKPVHCSNVSPPV